MLRLDANDVHAQCFILNSLLDKYGGLNFSSRCNYDKKFLTRISLPQFFNEILYYFLELTTSYNNFFPHQEFVLFNNKDVLSNRCSIFYKNWFEKGIYFIQDLWDADGNIMSYTEFTEKYLSSCNFLAYFQVTSAIPRNTVERVKVTTIENTDFLSKKSFPTFIRN